MSRWSHKLDLNVAEIFPLLPVFAEAFVAAGCPLSFLWALIDGTLRENCRPGQGQRCVYNGKDRIPGLKLQNVLRPDGLYASFFGPVEG